MYSEDAIKGFCDPEFTQDEAGCCIPPENFRTTSVDCGNLKRCPEFGKFKCRKECITENKGEKQIRFSHFVIDFTEKMLEKRRILQHYQFVTDDGQICNCNYKHFFYFS